MKKIRNIILIAFSIFIIIVITTISRRNEFLNKDLNMFYSNLYFKMDIIVFKIERMEQLFNELSVDEKLERSSSINREFIWLQNYIETGDKFLGKYRYSFSNIQNHGMLINNLENSQNNIMHFVDGGISLNNMILSNGFLTDGEISEDEMTFYNNISNEYKRILDILYYKDSIDLDSNYIEKAFEPLIQDFCSSTDIKRIKN